MIDGCGRSATLRGDRQRALLAMLLFNANEAVSAQRLIRAVWPGAPPKSCVSNLYTYVSRLRERTGDDRLVREGAGYRLRVEPDELDLLVFRAESELGRRAARAGDPETAAERFRRALGQWRDRPLTDLYVPVL